MLKSANLGARLGLVIGLLLAAFAAFLIVFFPNELHTLARQGVLERAQGIAQILAAASEAALDFDDAVGARQQLGALSSLSDADYARLQRADGTTLAGLHPERMPPDLPLDAVVMQARMGVRRVHVVVPMRTRGGRSGVLAVGFTLDALEQARARASLRVMAVSAAVLAFGLAAAVVLGTLLTRPLRRITSVAERIAEGDANASADLELDRSDEVGRLASAFDRMLRRLFGQREKIDSLNRDLEKRVVEAGRTNAELADRVEDLRRTQAQLIVADRRSSIATLAAGVAHEINNPLTFVIANVDFVAEYGSANATEEVKRALGEAMEGARRVQHIVKSLKTLSSSGDNEQRVALDIVEPLEAAINMANNEIKHRARLVRDLRPLPPVLGSEVQLGQVFLNLLINAAQAIAPGASEKNEVRVATRLDEQGRLVVEISDTGSGIPEEIRKQIFLPFFTTKPVGVGTGLGLSIVQGIVHSHGGEISVESEVGRGTCFRVALPLASAAVSQAAPVTRPKPARPAKGLRRGRVLVVDDEPMVCSTLKRSLAQHEVFTTCDVAEGLARISAGERFDVIICDLMMPGMSGAEFNAAVAGIDLAQANRTVFITGGAFTDATRAFLAVNEHRTLEKPLNLARLKEVVRAHVG